MTPISLPIAADHPAFAGHFPGTPIVPGVVLLDAALHAIAAATGGSLHACQLNSVKFLQPVAPAMAVSLVYEKTASGSIRFDILADTGKIASGSVLLVDAA
jgi:3-hydroxymyristoyl/3-hydroxydecanoyl-(acyl carrier protein) dehydratase